MRRKTLLAHWPSSSQRKGKILVVKSNQNFTSCNITNLQVLGIQ